MDHKNRTSGIKAECRNCFRSKWLACRGLCAVCYKRDGVRSLFPVARISQKNRGYGISGNGRYGLLPKEPTLCLPGSEEKVRVMMERASRGEALFHPDDASRIERISRALDPEPIDLDGD